MTVPDTPYTREEMYLNAAATGDSSGIPDVPYTRKEQYLNAIAKGDSSGIPDTPYTREEMYLDAIAKNGGGGGGGIDPVPITPTDHAGSYILGSNAAFMLNDPNAPTFSAISVDMSQYAGKVILIKNTGNRNYFGIYASIENDAPMKVYASRPSTQGTIVVPVDLFYTVNSDFRYLVYDYTSDNTTQGIPEVSVFDASEFFAGG